MSFVADSAYFPAASLNVVAASDVPLSAPQGRAHDGKIVYQLPSVSMPTYKHANGSTFFDNRVRYSISQNGQVRLNKLGRDFGDRFIESKHAALVQRLGLAAGRMTHSVDLACITLAEDEYLKQYLDGFCSLKERYSELQTRFSALIDKVGLDKLYGNHSISSIAYMVSVAKAFMNELTLKGCMLFEVKCCRNVNGYKKEIDKIDSVSNGYKEGRRDFDGRFRVSHIMRSVYGSNSSELAKQREKLTSLYNIGIEQLQLMAEVDKDFITPLVEYLFERLSAEFNHAVRQISELFNEINIKMNDIAYGRKCYSFNNSDISSVKDINLSLLDIDCSVSLSVGSILMDGVITRKMLADLCCFINEYTLLVNDEGAYNYNNYSADDLKRAYYSMDFMMDALKLYGVKFKVYDACSASRCLDDFEKFTDMYFM